MSSSRLLELKRTEAVYVVELAGVLNIAKYAQVAGQISAALKSQRRAPIVRSILEYDQLETLLELVTKHSENESIQHKLALACSLRKE